MKFVSFETTDDTLLSVSGLSTLGYGAQMAALPDLQHKLYFEDHVPKCKQWTQWFGNGLIMSGAQTVNLHNMDLTKDQKKSALKVASLNHALAAGLMTKQILDGDFKKPIGIASTVLQSALAIACAVRSCSGSDEE